MKKYQISILIIFALVGTTFSCKQELIEEKQFPEEGLNWRIGVQASSWRELTLFQIAERADSCKVKYVEGVRGMSIGDGKARKHP